MAEVYLFDFFSIVPSQAKPDVIKVLDRYLAACATKGSEPLRAWWWHADPSPSDLDVLVFITMRSHEIWKLKYPKKDLSDSSADGFTTWNPGDEVVATVFAGPYGGEGYAMLIFHEIMHMKLREGEEMHARGGLASACVSPHCKIPVTDITKENIAVMKNAFVHNRVKQWKDGPEKVFGKAQFEASMPGAKI